MNGIEELRRRWPWPATKPDVKPNSSGWFHGDCQRLLEQRIGPDTRVIIELGSWLGMSTRFFLQQAPSATVVAIDHWEGSREHQSSEFAEMLPVLYDTFLVNLWGYRDRLIPLRADTVRGIDIVAGLGIAPDLVYVDASHEVADVERDIRRVRQAFPGALIVGDDWTWPSVREGVTRALQYTLGVSLFVHGVCYEIPS